jgi:hypothetical protein
MAAKAGDVEVVSAFIKEGTDADARDAQGENALDYATRGFMYQDALATHPRSDEVPLPNYAEKFKEIKRILLAVRAKDEESSKK